MRAWMAAGLLLTSISGVAEGQRYTGSDPGPAGPVQYDVSFPNAAHHEARITVTYRHLRPGPVRFQMARSSPGRYALHEFAKNVYSVSATDGRGDTLSVTRTDPYGWSVERHDGTVSISYTLYGDHGDGTYAQIDRSHAHLNMPATFLWAVGYDDRPIRVRFRPADPTWKVATQLPDAGDGMTFWAPDLQYFMDSPAELSNFSVREWRVGDGAAAQTIRLAVHHQGSEKDVDRFADIARRVIQQHVAVFGTMPRFDYGRYTFIADYLPWVTDDGMEHRNSTIVIDTRGLAEAKFAQIQTLAHEFTHAWNVERIRPAELEPFDFTRANPSPSLWLAEGFTAYYQPLIVRRAGEMPVDALVQAFSRLMNMILLSPARRYGGPQEMSLRAPFNDAAKSIDLDNPNVFESYYVYGAAIALALDLELRGRYPGKSLDDYMRELWRRHGETERPYRPDDLRAALAAVTGDAAFADAFFKASIEGSSLPDYAPLMARAGLLLRPVQGASGWLGAQVKVEGGTLVLAEPPVPDSPMYKAGIDRGDILVSVNGKPVADLAAWSTAIEAIKPEARVNLVVRSRGTERQVVVTAASNPVVEVVRAEAVGQALTPAQRTFRTAWLGTGSVNVVESAR